MSGEDDIRAAFRQQAKACHGLGSPFTGRLCELAAERLGRDTAVGRAVLDWQGKPVADALALRFCGGLHALVLSDADDTLAAVYPPHDAGDEAVWDAVARALVAHEAFLLDFLKSPPQTNETARSAMLLPGFLLLARETGLPLAVHEIGASAGLNLNFDRFRYDYGGAELGRRGLAGQDVAGGARRHRTAAAGRAGRGLARRLRHLADRHRRPGAAAAGALLCLGRPDGAAGTARRGDLDCRRGGRVGRKGRRRRFRPPPAGGAKPGTAFVLFHSIMWQYMPQASKDGVLAALEEAGREATAEAPVARLRMEPRGETGFATLSLTTWPGGETRRLAKCDYHGRWIEWTGG